MNIKLFLKNFSNYLNSKLNKQNNNEFANVYHLQTHDIFYNEKTAQFYFKVVTDTGFICADMTMGELFSNSHVLNGLDRYSSNYVHYIRGRLE